MGTLMLLGFLNLGSGDRESELGVKCLGAAPCLLLSHCLDTIGSVEIIEVSVETGVHVCKALHDHPLPQGYIPHPRDLSLTPGIYPSRV